MNLSLHFPPVSSQIHLPQTPQNFLLWDLMEGDEKHAGGSPTLLIYKPPFPPRQELCEQHGSFWERAHKTIGCCLFRCMAGKLPWKLEVKNFAHVANAWVLELPPSSALL